MRESLHAAIDHPLQAIFILQRVNDLLEMDFRIIRFVFIFLPVKISLFLKIQISYLIFSAHARVVIDSLTYS